MQSSVKEDRNKYIGGSDIPVIMGISPFKTRYELLLEKAELKENDFQGNEYTDYGNIMESVIRDYVNKKLGREFKEGKHIENDIRCHTDGEDPNTILEIKTTSRIHDKVEDYKEYLCQLLFYMHHTNRATGILAVYNRPNNFSEEFIDSRLQLFEIKKEDYNDLIEKIEDAVEKFRIDLKKIKNNPFLTEEELMPNDLVELSNKVVKLEKELALMKKTEEMYEDAKEKLRLLMQETGTKKWETPNGIKITLVEDTPDKEVEVEFYDEEKFKEENLSLYENYYSKLEEYKRTKTTLKKGRKGYIKITLPKE